LAAFQDHFEAVHGEVGGHEAAHVSALLLVEHGDLQGIGADLPHGVARRITPGENDPLEIHPVAGGAGEMIGERGKASEARRRGKDGECALRPFGSRQFHHPTEAADRRGSVES
jgi:hypothetical protein